MGFYRKKPVVIEAKRFILDDDSPEEVVVWAQGSDPPCKVEFMLHDARGFYLSIPTLEGVMSADPGDWVIRGLAGEFYPIKDDIFQETYEKADSSERFRNRL